VISQKAECKVTVRKEGEREREREREKKREKERDRERENNEGLWVVKVRGGQRDILQLGKE
jgi:hypothetical protein